MLHWLSALTVIALFAVGYWMVELTYYSEWYRTAPYYHKSVGLLLALVTLGRVLWTFSQSRPVGLGKPWEVMASKAAHITIYLLLFCLFISGYLISTADGRGIDIFTWVTIPSLGELIENQEDVAGLIHEWLAYVLISLALIHGLAALKHHFVNKDVTLKRMLKPIKEKS